nr:PREDICTED: protein phosphatase 1 regulatory subunit 37 isoform X2 [Bemisia tabaci]
MSDTYQNSSSNIDRHLALRSSSVPSSCLRNNQDGNFRGASIVRNVSFPADESQIVSGFLEPANPWEYARNVTTEALTNEYIDSCTKHGVSALPAVLEQIKAATSLFDMLEYYESATHLVLSDNHLIDSRGWQACSRMIKRMRCLEILEARSVSLNDQLMPLLTRSLRVGSQLQVLKLENCHLTGRPFLILVSALKLNTNLKELFLGENYLDATDAAQIGSLLKCNNTLQFLDISNNIILDAGLGHIAEGISEQTGPGLNMLVVWNNHLTYGAAKFISLILARSSSLEMLNVGQNILTSDVIYTIKEGLQQNHMLLKFGLQSTNLTCEGAIALAEVIADNCTLQRIDLRDNNFQVAGLIALSLSMKENLTITQLDLDDTPQNYASVS